MGRASVGGDRLKVGEKPAGELRTEDRTDRNSEFLLQFVTGSRESLVLVLSRGEDDRR